MKLISVFVTLSAVLICACACPSAEQRTTWLEQIKDLKPADNYVYWRPLKSDPQGDAIMALRDYPKDFFKMRRIAKIKQTSDSIVVEGELSSMTFDAKSGGVRDVKMRDMRFNNVWLGETVLTLGDGTVIRGRDFTGELKATEDEDFIYLKGDFTARKPDGSDYGKIRLTYQIDPYIGFVQVCAEALTGLPGVVKLSFPYSLGPDSAKTLPDLLTVDEQGQWYIGPSNLGCFDLYPDKPEVLLPGNIQGGGRYYCGKQTDGRVMLEIICPGWWNADFDEAAYSDPKNDMFMRMGVRAGDEAFMDVHFINRKAAKAIPAGTTYKTCFSALPFKKLRPFAESYGSHNFFAGQPLIPVDRLRNEEEQMKTLAGMGATMYQGACATFIKDDGNGQPIASNTELPPPDMAHRLGLRHMNYIGQAGQYKVKFFNDEYGKSDALRDYFAINLGKPNAMYNPAIWSENSPFFPPVEAPDTPVYLCINAPKWRDYLLKNIQKNIWERLPNLDTLYVDDMCQYQCSNNLHGCSELGSTWFMGQYDYIRRIKKMIDEMPGNHYFTAHESLIFMNTHGHSDFDVNGECSGGKVPYRRAELNTGYNSSLIYGVVGCYYTASPGMGMSFNTRLFEVALSRCHQIFFNYYHPSVYGGGWTPFGPCSYQEADIKRHQKYMGPLQIFDIARSDLHHPYDEDFVNYCKGSVDGIVPVLYARDGDVLLTVAREGVAVKKSPNSLAEYDLTRAYKAVKLDLDLAKMGFESDKVWVYETTGPDLKEYAVNSGRLELPEIDANDGPRIFRILQASNSPTVLWHDVVGWRVVKVVKDSPRSFEFQMAGAPGASGVVYVQCGDRGNPSGVKGDAELISYDYEHGVAAIKVNYNENTALGTIRVAFSR